MFIAIAISPKAQAFSIDNEFVCQIVSEDPNITLENIKLNVYKSNPVYDEAIMEITHYNEELAFEVKSNKRGELVFKKPSDSFSIEVDLKSLPYGYGIDTKAMFISEDIENIDLKLFKVSDVKFIRKNNKINISVLNELEQPIYVIYETSVQHNTPILDIVGIKEFCSLIKVLIYDKVYEYNNIIDLSDYSFSNKVEFLFNLKLISEEEKEKLLTNYYLDVITNVPVISCNQVENTNIDEFEQNASVVPLSSIWTGSRDAGRFKVHYTSDQEANVAQYIANQFVEVENFFHNTLGYKKPTPSNMLATSYHIYLVTDLKDALGTTVNFPNGSYINLDYDYCRDSFNADSKPLDGAYKQAYTTISHEYFHGVMNEYKFSGNCDHWIKESFANWAAAVFLENHYNISPVKNILITRAKSFITSRQILTSDANEDAYQAYLFIYYLYYKFDF
jgi:hypothetical protein